MPSGAVEMLELDPRPTSQKKALPMLDLASEGRKFAFRLHEIDVQWQIKDKGVFVTEIVRIPLTSSGS